MRSDSVRIPTTSPSCQCVMPVSGARAACKTGIPTLKVDAGGALLTPHSSREHIVPGRCLTSLLPDRTSTRSGGAPATTGGRELGQDAEEEVEEEDRREAADRPMAPEARPTGGAQGSGHQPYDEPPEGSDNAELWEAAPRQGQISNNEFVEPTATQALTQNGPTIGQTLT